MVKVTIVISTVPDQFGPVWINLKWINCGPRAPDWTKFDSTDCWTGANNTQKHLDKLKNPKLPVTGMISSTASGQMFDGQKQKLRVYSRMPTRVKPTETPRLKVSKIYDSYTVR